MAFKGYVYVIFGGLVLLAAIILLALQWGNTCSFSLYGKNINDANTGALMLASVAGGMLLPLICKILFRGIGHLRRARKQKRQKAAAVPPAGGA